MASPAPTGHAGLTGVAGRTALAEELVHTSIWTDELVAASGLPVVDMPFVTVGGGLGSFVMVDYLRIAGVPAGHIRTLTVLDHPWQNYEYLLASSQVTRDKRIRSDSSSTLDNIWGFPGYAVREAVGARTPSDFVAPLWNVLTENVLCDYWTPRSGQVFRSMQREADRIDYWSTLAMGRAHVTRRRHGGGYFTVLTRADGGDAGEHIVYRSSFVHLAVGYPGLAYLPDLVDYRDRYGDSHRVVNAYEPHEQVYEELNRRGGTVIVRGAGIVASQVLDRLISDRDRLGTSTSIIHLFRTYVDGPHGPSAFLRRRGGHGWAYQGFNWPKSTWGGQDKNRVRRAEGEDRAKVLRTLGGTTTPYRRRWQRQLERGRREGFYRMHVGEVQEVVPGPFGSVVTRLRPGDAASNGGTLELTSNFVIDATGLEADIAEHTLLADLLQHSGASRNLLGRLDVEPHFEVRGSRAEPGRLYAVGAATLGGYLAGVDTFLGLQIAALEICDDLARQRFCKRIGVVRSTVQWWKWALDAGP